MEEKRRSERLPVEMQLSIFDLYKQNTDGIHNLDSPIEIVDISKHGIGFISECVLPLNYFFNARVTLSDDTPAIFTVVKIVRCDVIDRSHYRYGCEFSQLADNLAEIIEKYSMNYTNS